MALDKGNAVRRVISILVVLVMLCLLPVSAGVAAQAPAVLNVAYQYGLAYAPLIVMKEYGMIQKHYDGAVEVNWQVLNSGVAINEGIVVGQIDVGAMGVAPAIVGVMRGIPYKIFSNISSQPHGLMTNSTDIQTLSDITSDKKIALVGIGSIQHIFLSMLALHDLGDAHALDNNIIAMSHPDGMTALISGAVDCQLTNAGFSKLPEALRGMAEERGKRNRALAALGTKSQTGRSMP